MRTKNSIKNILSNVFFNLLIAAIGFIKIKVFLKGLSEDIYSLNQLFYQIFSYLTIADIGFNLIINKNLYKAFSEKNQEEINKIYSTAKKFYNVLGVILIFASIIISFFVKYLTKVQIDLGYIQLIFLIFILNNLLDYFFEAPKSIILADQKYYKINHLVRGTKILSNILQIILVLCKLDYVFVILPSIFITLAINIYINMKIFKEYPELKDIYPFNKKYLAGTKDLISSKIAGILNSNTDIILISTFVSPLAVNIYSSYNYIINFINSTIHVMAIAITPSYANLFNKEETETNNENKYKIFTEINVLFLFSASFVCIMIYMFLDNVIILWLGQKYLSTKIVLIFFVILAYINITMKSIDIVINSKGLFKEVRNILIAEAIVNLVVSLILVQKFQIPGVVLATIIASYTTTFIQKPIYLYKNIFKQNPIKYYIEYIIACLITASAIYLLSFLNIKTENITELITEGIKYSMIIGISLYLIFMLLLKSFRNLNYRFFNILKIKYARRK